MKYNGMPAGMWMLFKKQFQKALVVDLGYDLSDAKRIAKAAKPSIGKLIPPALAILLLFQSYFHKNIIFYNTGLSKDAQ